jgi:Phosphoribosylamine-glycine ligase
LRILLLGGGAREHAIAWALKKSERVEALEAAPGNPGIARIAPCHDIDPCDPVAVLDLVESIKADHVVVGPEPRWWQAWRMPFAKGASLFWP